MNQNQDNQPIQDNIILKRTKYLSALAITVLGLAFMTVLMTQMLRRDYAQSLNADVENAIQDKTAFTNYIRALQEQSSGSLYFVHGDVVHGGSLIREGRYLAKKHRKQLEKSKTFNKKTLESLHDAQLAMSHQLLEAEKLARLLNDSKNQNQSQASQYQNSLMRKIRNITSIADAIELQGQIDSQLIEDKIHQAQQRKTTAQSKADTVSLIVVICVVIITIGIIFLLTHSISKTSSKLLIEKQNAESANKTKSEFLASMSHELRTPLNGVIGMTELLRNTQLTDRQKRFVDACHSSGTSLLNIINDILDFSKIEAGHLELDHHNFNLQLCIDDTISMIAHRAHQQGLEISYQTDPRLAQTFTGDSVRLKQIMVNLLGNAIKFTQQGQVTLDAKVIEQKDQTYTVKFQITDTGLGIPEDKRDRLFKSFSQADRSTTRRFGGTGLGLSICKSLALAMQGDIGVDSIPGKGSTFWFTIQIHCDKKQQTLKQDYQISTLNKLNQLSTLLIDNNPTSREILSQNFASWETQVRPISFTDPRLVEERISDFLEPHDLIVISVPVVGNYKIIDQIIDATQKTNQKILFLTPVSNVFDPPQSIHARSKCITKPASPSELFNATVDLICLPCKTKIQATQQETQKISATQKLKGHILLAEDHLTNQLYVCELLHHIGLEVQVANNGIEVLQLIYDQNQKNNNKFDLILMDCQMPELDGFTTAQKIRERESLNNTKNPIPIVALTANAIKGDRERCIAAGMDDYLTKPVQANELIETISQYLKQTTSQNAPSPQSQSQLAPQSQQTQVPSNKPKPAPEPQNQTTQESLPLDKQAMLQRCMGDPSFLNNMLQSFAAESPKYITQLEQSILEKDPEKIASAAHAIKGAAGMITANALQQAAQIIELQGKNKQLEDIQSNLENLLQQNKTCIQYIQTVCDESSNQTSAA